MGKASYDFKEGEVLLVDKPLHWTSFDVVNKLRWRLKEKYGVKKFKVGHAGTLDPLATGLLVICTGKSTKKSESFSSENKAYEGTFLLGKTTPSFDLETDFDQILETSHITAEKIKKTAQQFIGKQKQTPPIFSAKKVNGIRAYEAARKGEEIKLKAREITIHSFQIKAIRLPKMEVEVTISCSKGTYIRSIANDFGKELDSGATLSQLRRIKSGDFHIEDAKTVAQWIEEIEQATIPKIEM